MLVTDGAPSMAGKVSGLAACWSAGAPQITSLHCIGHQMVLCAKLSGELKTTMDNVMATINYICFKPHQASNIANSASCCQKCLLNTTTCFCIMTSGGCPMVKHWSVFVISERRLQLSSTAASTKRRKHTWKTYWTITSWPMSAFCVTYSNTWMT